MISIGRLVLMSGVLVLMAALGGCTASPATKVQCESKLRPINPASLEHRQP